MTGSNLTVTSPAWQQFVEKRQVDPASVPEIVIDSWSRCAGYNIDPYRLNDTDILSQRALRERLRENKQLLETAGPVIQNLYGLLKGSGYTVFLTDNQGYILASEGDPDFTAKAQKILLSVGANWHESVRGTNAIGTTLATQQPVNINSWQHYCRENHFIVCSAAPIWGSNGELLGVLDVTGNYQRAHPHTLALVVSAVSLIQHRLALSDSNRKLVIADLYTDTIMESSGEGYVCVDGSDKITRVNHRFAQTFGLHPEQCVGQPLSSILNEDSSAWMELLDGPGRVDKLFRQASLRHGFTYSIRSIWGKKQRWLGAVASIKNVKQPRQQTPGLTNTTHYTFADIIGRSPRLQNTKRLAELASRIDSTVLLQGETGTGKEMFAQSIHHTSNRREGPFVAVNCGALPKTLIESELFGYEEGAFTGARRGGRQGKFELANGGTIFLDEIGDMPLDIQASLLRVLEERQVVRIGGQRPVSVDIRVIAATNKNLAEEAASGNFRPDLFYRLNVLSIDIPSLRDREDDIMELAEYFMRVISNRLGKVVNQIAYGVKVLFQNYNWPGNVRELENIIERAISFCEGTTIALEDIPEYLKQKQPLPGNNPDVSDLNLRQLEEQAITEALNKFDNNVSKVAQALGIGRNTLYRKMKEYDIKSGG
ncbi:Acetoin catabolism regulatory protein [Pelotomaculum sp. FP]|uniref:sigma-54-dependent Fis family transcriptional regulator n=1 Tax=Pelotomaculum sp. FP TaxID=261474 RepID=UPI0011055212|nr:sigma-54-dependent Fis family transcriptional regulator [Pelotomaculum sp. FP]TEB15794.1 Acetoin catabolism regulatory protein [Pelotomaculum sp. FP]